MNTIEKKAPAKINLGLDVVGKRPNGYHDVKMVMQTLTLHDSVKIEISDTADFTNISMEVKSEEPFIDISYIPTNEKNLCVKAAQALLDFANFSFNKHIHITLTKKIPSQAGLGGGSSDAAAVMLALNEILSLNISNEDLSKIAVKIGADIPFFLQGGTKIATGIGEELTPILPPLPQIPILLVKPDFGSPTGGIYTALDSIDNPTHPDVDRLIKSIIDYSSSNGSLSQIGNSLGNILEDVVLPQKPRLKEIESSLNNFGACGCLMTGSGTTIFGLFDNTETLDKAMNHLRNIYPDYFIKKCFTSPEKYFN